MHVSVKPATLSLLSVSVILLTLISFVCLSLLSLTLISVVCISLLSLYRGKGETKEVRQGNVSAGGAGVCEQWAGRGVGEARGREGGM